MMVKYTEMNVTEPFLCRATINENMIIQKIWVMSKYQKGGRALR